MKFPKKLVVCLAALLEASMITSCRTGYSSAVRYTTPSTISNTDSCIINLINQDRESLGVAPLAVDVGLSSYTTRHSQQMAASGAIYHSGGSPLMPEPSDSQFRAALPQPWQSAIFAGENVGYDTQGCVAMNSLYMSSPQHRANILNPRWTQMGIGDAFDSNGALYSTEDFVEFIRIIPSPASPVVTIPTIKMPTPIFTKNHLCN
jgi:uncharacterized protein YkwD